MEPKNSIEVLLNKDKLNEIFPKNRADEFFEALFGDAEEGAFDIELGYRNSNGKSLTMELVLQQRPGRCLACNLTHGLPQVFSRHPIININGLVQQIDTLLGDTAKCGGWSLGHTEQQTRSTHTIPLTIELQ